MNNPTRVRQVRPPRRVVLRNGYCGVCGVWGMDYREDMAVIDSAESERLVSKAIAAGLISSGALEDRDSVPVPITIEDIRDLRMLLEILKRNSYWDRDSIDERTRIRGLEIIQRLIHASE